MTIFEEWENILRKFPPELQKEFRDERPTPDKNDIEEWNTFILVNTSPLEISIADLLKHPANQMVIARTPCHIREDICKNWGLDISQEKVYSRTPWAFTKYAKLSGNTAPPSVMLNDEIIFGCHRFIAALMRNDTHLRVWELVTNAS